MSIFNFPVLFEAHPVLFEAQKAAHLPLNSFVLPRISYAFISQQSPLWQLPLMGYSGTLYVTDKLYDGAAALVHTIGKIARAIFYLPYCLLPINPITGKHHFTICSIQDEKILGILMKYLLSPFSDENISRKFIDDRADNPVLASSMISDISTQLLQKNAPLLASEFDIQVSTINAPIVNAYSAPGGYIRIYDGLVRTIQQEITTRDLEGAIKESTISLADGSKITINLGDIQLQDVLACTIGHEMSHTAARHIAISLFLEILAGIVLAYCTYFVVTCFQASTLAGIGVLIAYNGIDQESMHTMIEHMEEILSTLFSLGLSRQMEYEADIGGAYAAHQAGYNPLGALFFFEVMEKRADTKMLRFFEPLLSHPRFANRKKALFAALQNIYPEKLQEMKAQGKIKYTKGSDHYSTIYSSPAVRYAHKLARAYA